MQILSFLDGTSEEPSTFQSLPMPSGVFTPRFFRSCVEVARLEALVLIAREETARHAVAAVARNHVQTHAAAGYVSAGTRGRRPFPGSSSC